MELVIPDSVDKNEVYWLLDDIRWSLANNEYFTRHGWDWEIVYVPITYPCTSPVKFPDRVEVMTKSYQRGDIHPPIFVDDSCKVMDGLHRVAALKVLGVEQVVCARPVGDGEGRIVKDEYFAPFLGEFKPIKERDPRIYCLECRGEMVRPINPEGYKIRNYGREIVDLEKKGDPMLKCPDCGRKYPFNFLVGWTIVG